MAIADDLVEECQSDFIGLWVIHGIAEAEDLQGDSDDARDITLSVVRHMLNSGKVVVGQFDSNAAFVPWECTNEEAICRIRREWHQLGRDPNIGEIAWFGPATMHLKIVPIDLELDLPSER